MGKEYEYQVNENRKIILSIIYDGFLIKDAIFIND